jgi:hypothetical protein
LDQLGLLVTNYLQAYILDGSPGDYNVVDYVQLRAPITVSGLNQALADPSYPTNTGAYMQWSTNTPGGDYTPFGVLDQIYISGHPPTPYGSTPASQMPLGGQWITAPTPMGDMSPEAEAAFFNAFFTPGSTLLYKGKAYHNTNLSIEAPYTPTRTVYSSFLLQANDPLVHYLSSDLNSQFASLAIWANGDYLNGVWTHSDDPGEQPMPIAQNNPVGGRYQPWGNNEQLGVMGAAVADSNPYNVAYKDPLVWSSDYWNFPTGQAWNLSWIGQVHRGTPWQTIFLKSTNILQHWTLPYGLMTWVAWTGDFQTNAPSNAYLDAVSSAPVMDWQTVSLLAALLNTNDPLTQISVNNPDPNAWAIALDGMIALTNTLLSPLAGRTPQFSSIVISSNSIQAQIIANAIQATRLNTNLFPQSSFGEIGLVLATPQLSVQSPFLNTNGVPIGARQASNQLDDGISDQAYEAIPSQLLSTLRMDVIGKLTSTDGQMRVQFSGYDGLNYALQVSPDLLNWTSLYTNSPVDGLLKVLLPATGTSGAQFYRTVLVQ